MKRLTRLDGLPQPTGPYAWAVAFGDMLFVSGLRGIDATSGKPVEGDRERVDLIFQYLERILAANGSCPRLVLATRVYVTDMATLRPLVNEGYDHFFGTEQPTRTIVEVRGLNQDDSIEIEAVAAREVSRA